MAFVPKWTAATKAVDLWRQEEKDGRMFAEPFVCWFHALIRLLEPRTGRPRNSTASNPAMQHVPRIPFSSAVA